MEHSETSYQCYFTQTCGIRSYSLHSFVTHLRTFHQYENNSFTCNLEGCLDIFHTVSNFRKHVSNVHKHLWNEDFKKNISNSAVQHTESDNLVDNPTSACASSTDKSLTFAVETSASGYRKDDDHSSTADMYEGLLRRMCDQISCVSLRLQYEYNIPKTKVDNVMVNVADIIKDFKQGYDNCLSSEFENIQIPSGIASVLEDRLSLETSLDQALRKNDGQLRTMGYIEPIEIVFSAHDAEKKDCGHYVPVEETLVKYLSRSDVFENIRKERVMGGVLDKLSAGQIMKKHPILSADNTSIRLVFYTDEFQLANPIGPHTKENSIVGVYFSVNNIETYFNSKLKHIHLALLVKEVHVKKYSQETVFKQIIDDLKRLEMNGVTVVVNSVEHHLKVVLAVFSGDNKSIHTLGCFNPTFSSGKVRRFCLIDFKDLASVHHESECVLRTAEVHDYHVKGVVNEPALSKVYGVTGISPFSVLQSFHPALSLPSDVMHDIYEGVMPFNLVAVLKGLVKDGIITMEKISQLFEDFKYGPSDNKDKHSGPPSKLSKKQSSLSGTAAEKISLFYVFSLVLGSEIPKNNRYWELHLKCLKMCDVLLAPVLKVEWVPYLSILIQDYLYSWSELPREVVGSVKPKMHFLVHMPRLTKYFGPLRPLSCMKYEHFHQPHKQEARSKNNYINPTLTLSRNFQKKRCLEYSSSNIFEYVKIDGAQKTVGSGTLEQCEKRIVTAFFQSSNIDLLSVKKIKLCSVCLVVGEFVVIDVTNDIAVFLKIVSIYRFNDHWAVYGKLTVPVSWDAHFHAYEIRPDDQNHFVCVNPQEVLPLQTLSLYSVKQKKFLKLRHTPLKI